jgi:hypothetical protein
VRFGEYAGLAGNWPGSDMEDCRGRNGSCDICWHG